MFWSLVRPDRILPPITKRAAVTTSLAELAVGMITLLRRRSVRRSKMRRILNLAIDRHAASGHPPGVASSAGRRTRICDIRAALDLTVSNIVHRQEPRRCPADAAGAACNHCHLVAPFP